MTKYDKEKKTSLTSCVFLTGYSFTSFEDVVPFAESEDGISLTWAKKTGELIHPIFSIFVFPSERSVQTRSWLRNKLISELRSVSSEAQLPCHGRLPSTNPTSGSETGLQRFRNSFQPGRIDKSLSQDSTLSTRR
jgi:hypothetical protein